MANAPLSASRSSRRLALVGEAAAMEVCAVSPWESGREILSVSGKPYPDMRLDVVGPEAVLRGLGLATRPSSIGSGLEAPSSELIFGCDPNEIDLVHANVRAWILVRCNRYVCLLVSVAELWPNRLRLDRKPIVVARAGDGRLYGARHPGILQTGTTTLLEGPVERLCARILATATARAEDPGAACSDEELARHLRRPLEHGMDHTTLVDAVTAILRLHATDDGPHHLGIRTRTTTRGDASRRTTFQINSGITFDGDGHLATAIGLVIDHYAPHGLPKEDFFEGGLVRADSGRLVVGKPPHVHVTDLVVQPVDETTSALERARLVAVMEDLMARLARENPSLAEKVRALTDREPRWVK